MLVFVVLAYSCMAEVPMTYSPILLEKNQITVQEISSEMDEKYQAELAAKKRNRVIMQWIRGTVGVATLALLGAGAYYSYEAQKAIDKQKAVVDAYFAAGPGTDFDAMERRFYSMNDDIQTKIDRSKKMLGFGAGSLMVWGLLYAF